MSKPSEQRPPLAIVDRDVAELLDQLPQSGFAYRVFDSASGRVVHVDQVREEQAPIEPLPPPPQVSATPKSLPNTSPKPAATMPVVAPIITPLPARLELPVRRPPLSPITRTETTSAPPHEVVVSTPVVSPSADTNKNAAEPVAPRVPSPTVSPAAPLPLECRPVVTSESAKPDLPVVKAPSNSSAHESPLGNRAATPPPTGALLKRLLGGEEEPARTSPTARDVLSRLGALPSRSNAPSASESNSASSRVRRILDR